MRRSSWCHFLRQLRSSHCFFFVLSVFFFFFIHSPSPLESIIAIPGPRSNLWISGILIYVIDIYIYISLSRGDLLERGRHAHRDPIVSR